MKTTTPQVRVNCERHPKLPAERIISGIPMCSQCVRLETADGGKESAKKGVARRRRNRAQRSPTRAQEYGTWEAAFLVELQKAEYRGVSEILHRPEITPHIQELLGRIFQYCSVSVAGENSVPRLRALAKKATGTLRRAAKDLRAVRSFQHVVSRWHSYVLDQIVLKPGTASKAGEWLLPEWRNGQRRPLEPEQLEDEAHDLTALATALASINKALAKLGDGAVAPVLVYLDLYLKTLFQTATTVPLLVKLLNAGLAASGVRLRVTPQTLWKRLRDYRRQHKITVHQLQLRVRIMIEGPGCLTAPGVRAYTFDSEPLDLPTGAHTFAPRCPALPPLPSRTE